MKQLLYCYQYSPSSFLRSHIYKGLSANSSPLTTASTPNMLQCDRLIDFWIRWAWNKGVRVGQGQLDQGQIMEYTDSNQDNIHSISLTTGDGTAGEWQFSYSKGYYPANMSN